MTKWLDSSGKDEDVVVSTRLRIARNIEDYRFPDFMSIDESNAVTNKVLDAMKSSDDIYNFYRINDLNNTERNVFVEEHLISPSLIETSKNASFLLRCDEKATIMINEEEFKFCYQDLILRKVGIFPLASTIYWRKESSIHLMKNLDI